MSTSNRQYTSSSVTLETKAKWLGFLSRVGLSEPIPPATESKQLITELTCGLLHVNRAHRGHVSCLLSVKPSATNIYGGMHGGAVASVAEEVSMACARTVVGEEKELFLGEISISYLSSAPRNAELKVDASVSRSGRNLTVVAAEFRLKDSGDLMYTSRATFYSMPVASL